MGRDDLLWSQADGVGGPANPRAKNEDSLPGDNRRYQIRNEFRSIASVAVEEDQNVGVIAHCGDACLDGATVAASRLDDHASSGSRRALGRTVPRAPVDNDDFTHILREHRGYDLPNRGFLVEAWNNRSNDGRAARRRLLLADLVGHPVYRLQRRPQLAQLLGGLSESSAVRKSRYAGPFQISRKDCRPAWPSV